MKKDEKTSGVKKGEKLTVGSKRATKSTPKKDEEAQQIQVRVRKKVIEPDPKFEKEFLKEQAKEAKNNASSSSLQDELSSIDRLVNEYSKSLDDKKKTTKIKVAIHDDKKAEEQNKKKSEDSSAKPKRTRASRATNKKELESIIEDLPSLDEIEDIPGLVKKEEPKEEISEVDKIASNVDAAELGASEPEYSIKEDLIRAEKADIINKINLDESEDSDQISLNKDDLEDEYLEGLASDKEDKDPVAKNNSAKIDDNFSLLSSDVADKENNQEVSKADDQDQEFESASFSLDVDKESNDLVGDTPNNDNNSKPANLPRQEQNIGDDRVRSKVDEREENFDEIIASDNPDFIKQRDKNISHNPFLPLRKKHRVRTFFLSLFALIGLAFLGFYGYLYYQNGDVMLRPLEFSNILKSNENLNNELTDLKKRNSNLEKAITGQEEAKTFIERQLEDEKTKLKYSNDNESSTLLFSTDAKFNSGVAKNILVSDSRIMDYLYSSVPGDVLMFTCKFNKDNLSNTPIQIVGQINIDNKTITYEENNCLNKLQKSSNKQIQKRANELQNMVKKSVDHFLGTVEIAK
ncbi:MAG: hypothetical protein ACFNM5_02690 [Candidatus Saccharibacteria bacterium]